VTTPAQEFTTAAPDRQIRAWTRDRPFRPHTSIRASRTALQRIGRRGGLAWPGSGLGGQELGGGQLAVEVVGFDQFVVGADGAHSAGVDDEDPVGAVDGG
jgi:hypothetical protein